MNILTRPTIASQPPPPPMCRWVCVARDGDDLFRVVAVGDSEREARANAIAHAIAYIEDVGMFNIAPLRTWRFNTALITS